MANGDTGDTGNDLDAIGELNLPPDYLAELNQFKEGFAMFLESGLNAGLDPLHLIMVVDTVFDEYGFEMDMEDGSIDEDATDSAETDDLTATGGAANLVTSTKGGAGAASSPVYSKQVLRRVAAKRLGRT